MSKFVTLHGFGGGSGGTELNFEIVGGTTEPSNPTENMIWVNTTTNITGWSFMSSKPSLIETIGWVYIISETSANNQETDFDIFKSNNSMWINPVSVWQNENNTLVQKIIKIYKNNTWISLEEFLYANGVQETTFSSGSTVSLDASASADWQNSKLYLNINVTYNWGQGSIYVYTTETQPTAKKSKLRVKYSGAYGTTLYGTGLVIGVSSSPSMDYTGAINQCIASATVDLTNTTEGILELDISNIQSDYKIIVGIYNNAVGGHVYHSSYVYIEEISLL